MNRRSFLKAALSLVPAPLLARLPLPVSAVAVVAPVVSSSAKWTTPQTWASGEFITAENLNTYISDGISRYIAGERIPAGQAVYIGDDGKAYGVYDHSKVIRGVAFNSAEPEGTVDALTSGVLSGMPPPSEYYMSE
jgi:hypothetical protein